MLLSGCITPVPIVPGGNFYPTFKAPVKRCLPREASDRTFPLWELTTSPNESPQALYTPPLSTWHHTSLGRPWACFCVYFSMPQSTTLQNCLNKLTTTGLEQAESTLESAEGRSDGGGGQSRVLPS
jgi:hypothetical protein